MIGQSKLHALMVRKSEVKIMDFYSTTQQAGSTATEYLLLTSILIIALLLPIPVLGISAAEFIFQAFVDFQHSSTYLLSMP